MRVYVDPVNDREALWSAYVSWLFEESKTNGVGGMPVRTQGEFATALGSNQPTISRWLNGLYVPDNAAEVAHMARKLGRNPLEAFVAAGMLSQAEAGRGLEEQSRDLLREMRREAQIITSHGRGARRMRLQRPE